MNTSTAAEVREAERNIAAYNARAIARLLADARNKADALAASPNLSRYEQITARGVARRTLASLSLVDGLLSSLGSEP